jgi:hypothetical protein
VVEQVLFVLFALLNCLTFLSVKILSCQGHLVSFEVSKWHYYRINGTMVSIVNVNDV